MRWWARRSNPQRLDMSIRWSLYVITALWPVTIVLAVQADPQSNPAGLLTLVALLILQTAACVAVLRNGLAVMLGGARVDRRLIIVAAALTVGAMLAALLAFPHSSSDPPTALVVAMLTMIALTAALTPVISTAVLIGAILLGSVITAGWETFGTDSDWSSGLVIGVLYVVAAGLYAMADRVSEWMLVLVWEIEASRAVQSRLAVAEERLRFARDFHDTLGRNLTVIAVTSDLAARLAGRGDQQTAAEHMLQVQQLAHESAREVRELVSGYRTADLDTELAGARSVLRAAGIKTRIIGDSSGLTGAAQSAFGWVLREATTNVLRHSDATSCTIELEDRIEPAGEMCILTVRNDGARPADPLRPTGHGISGLGERLATLSGEISTTAAPDGHFVVQARVPRSPSAATRAAGPHPSPPHPSPPQGLTV